MVLETLVKLAAFGTSGICVLAIFWSGWLIQRTEDRGKLETVRFFIGATVAIAIISGTSGVLNAYIKAGTIHRLEAEKAAVSTNLVEQRRVNETLRVQQDSLRRTLSKIAGLQRGASTRR